MHLMLLVVGTGEVDAIVPLLQLRKVLLIEDLEIRVLEDLEGVEPGFVVGLVLDGEGGSRGDDHDCECVMCLCVRDWNDVAEVEVRKGEGREAPHQPSARLYTPEPGIEIGVNRHFLPGFDPDHMHPKRKASRKIIR